MYKHFCLFCAYLFITCFTAFAQPGRCQNIYHQYITETKGLKEDTGKVLRYLKFVSLLDQCLPDTGLSITYKALKLSEKLNYQHGIELSIYQEGAVAEIKNNLPLAISYYKQATKIAEQHKWYADIYERYNNCLNIYYYQADYPSAMDIAQKGLTLAEQLNNKEDQAHYDNQIGFIYQKQEKPDESIKYCTQYLMLANEIHNQMMVADACNGIADGYLLKKDYKTSLLYFFRALNIYKGLNEASSPRFDRVRTSNRHERIAYTSFKISTVYKQAGDYEQALYYSLAIFDMYNKRNKKGLPSFNPYDLASYEINMGDIYRLLKNYRQANVFLSKGLAISRSIQHREDMRDAYEALSQNFAAQKRYDSAYSYHILFTGLKDSIINEKVSREINNLEVERRDKEIALLNQQQQLKENEAAKQNLRRNFFIGFIGLIAVISFLLLYIQSGIKQQKLVFEKQAAVHHERQRISSDMHDDIGTGLSTMLIYVNMLKLKLANSDEGPSINRIADLGTGLVDQMKEIVWALSPGNDRLDSLLLFTRQYFVLLFEPLNCTTNIIFPLTIPGTQLEGEVRRNIFLCVKEALNNVIKHANASLVELRVEITNNTLTIQIKDNGQGLFVPAGSTTGGNGLKNMIRRMNSIKGKADIFSDNGTVVRLELNLPQYPNG